MKFLVRPLWLSFLSQVQMHPCASCHPGSSTHSVGWRGRQGIVELERSYSSNLLAILSSGVSPAGSPPPRPLRVYCSEVDQYS